MIAQRRINNHLDTIWTHSPRVNYSRIIPKAGMVMKKASGMNSPIRQGVRKSFRFPQSRDGDGGGYRLFRGFLIPVLRVFVLGGFYRRRGKVDGVPGGHTPWWRALGLAAPPPDVVTLVRHFVSPPAGCREELQIPHLV